MKDKILKKIAIILAKLLLKVFKQVHGKYCDLNPKEFDVRCVNIWIYSDGIKIDTLNIDKNGFANISSK